jgi:hypothetical protein
MNPEIKQKIFDLLNAAGLIGEGKTIDQCSDEDLINGLINHAITLSNVSDTTLSEAEKTARQTEVTNLLKSLITPVTAAANEPPAGDDDTKKLLSEARKLLCESMLDKELGASPLPAPVKEKYRKLFGGKIFEKKDLTDALVLEQKILAEIFPKRVDNHGLDLRFRRDGVDKLKLGFEHIFMSDKVRAKLTEAERKEFKDAGVDGVYSIKELYVALTGDDKVTGYLQKGRLAEGLVTSDFASILSNAIYRTMIQEYTESIEWDSWRQVCNSGSLVDFREKPLLAMGGYTDLPIVNEDGDFTDANSPTDREVKVQADSRGYIDWVSRRMILNDDVGAIRLIPMKMAKAAKRTLYKFAFNLILTNPQMFYDKTALFHADHNNLITSALDGTSYGIARRKMLDQTEQDSLEKLGIRPKYLLIPPFEDMEKMAYNLVTVAYGVRNDVPEWFQTWKVIPISIQHWTDPNDWILTADPGENPTVEVDFLQGQQEPQLFTQDTPASDSFFVKERIRYKIRHEYGGTVLDHRSFVKSDVPNPAQ